MLEYFIALIVCIFFVYLVTKPNHDKALKGVAVVSNEEAETLPTTTTSTTTTTTTSLEETPIIYAFARKTGGRTIMFKYGINDPSTPFILGEATTEGARYVMPMPSVGDLVYVSSFRNGDEGDKGEVSIHLHGYSADYTCTPSVEWDGVSNIYFQCDSNRSGSC